MPRVVVTTPSPDSLTIAVGPDVTRAVVFAGGALLLALAFLALPAGGWSLFGLSLGAVAWPWLALLSARALRPRRHVVSRTPGRLFFDGDPLELARVELRLVQWPLVRRPRGYALSLWMLTSAGPVDLPLGHFADLLSASAVSGELEEFVQQAGPARARHLS